jgi:hypothetical protein
MSIEDLSDEQRAVVEREAACNQRIKDLFGSDIGKLVLQDLFELAGMHQADLPDSTGIELAYAAGRRCMMMAILTRMDLGSQGVIDAYMLRQNVQQAGVQQEVHQ